ncbi:hypothetical protein EDB19DRAFT_1225329 [Suillus lakei]|nr:hypothetical protein EDB19DRAFT_1225329 [Suillus lakei]
MIYEQVGLFVQGYSMDRCFPLDIMMSYGVLYCPVTLVSLGTHAGYLPYLVDWGNSQHNIMHKDCALDSFVGLLFIFFMFLVLFITVSLTPIFLPIVPAHMTQIESIYIP